MAELDEEIREIKREIVESRGLVIKTSNLLNAHAADLKAIAKRQAGYEQRFQWNGWVAYILFAALSFIGLRMATESRVSEVTAQLREREREVESSNQELAAVREEKAARRSAEEAADGFYRLIRERRASEVVTGYARIQQLALSPAETSMFRDAFAQSQVAVARDTFQSGLEFARTGRHAEAADAFQEALRLDDSSVQAVAVKLALAQSLARTGQHARAKLLATEVAEQTLDPQLQDDGVLLFASTAEELGSLDEVQAALRTYLRRWTHGQYSVEVRRRLADVTRRIVRGPPHAP